MFKNLTLFFLLLNLMACTSVKVKPLPKLNTAKSIYEEALKLVAGKDYDKGITYFNYLRDNFKSSRNEKYVSLSTYEIGFCHYKKGDDETAIKYFDEVLSKARLRSARVLASMLKGKIKRGDGYKNASYN